MDKANRQKKSAQTTHLPGQDGCGNADDFDISFSYYFRWDCPDKHIKEALKALLRSHLTEVPGSGSAADPMGHEARLLPDEAFAVRWLIAVNPHSPAAVLDGLAWDESPRLLERIAENPNTSAATLSRLSRSEHEAVRAAVAENSNTLPEDVWRLLDDESPDVRYRLAEDPRLPVEILEVLAADDNPYVQHRARRTLNRLNPSRPVRAHFAGRTAGGRAARKVR